MNEATYNEMCANLPELSNEEFKRNYDLTLQMLSKLVLPPSWKKQGSHPLGHPLFGQNMFIKGSPRNGLRVIADCSYIEGKPWIHASCSRKDRMPTYEDMVEMKAVFIGAERQAIQIFPKRSQHINIHNFCLHLWSSLEGDGLPDFGKYGTI